MTYDAQTAFLASKRNQVVRNMPCCLPSHRIPQWKTPTLASRPTGDDLEVTVRIKAGHGATCSLLVPYSALTCPVSTVRRAQPPWLVLGSPGPHHHPLPSHRGSTEIKAKISPLSDEWLSERDVSHTDRPLSVGLSAETWNC